MSKSEEIMDDYNKVLEDSKKISIITITEIDSGRWKIESDYDETKAKAIVLAGALITESYVAGKLIEDADKFVNDFNDIIGDEYGEELKKEMESALPFVKSIFESVYTQSKDRITDGSALNFTIAKAVTNALLYERVKAGIKGFGATRKFMKVERAVNKMFGKVFNSVY